MPGRVRSMTADGKPMALPGATKPSDHRRSNKPIMEKRRRARINNCLGELKGLILEAMKKDPTRHTKLEKADILEMTVKHLQTLQRQQMAIAVATDPTVMTKFRSGFNECASEVARYVSRIDGVDPAVRQRLVNHLRNCLTGLGQLTPATFACLLPPGSVSGPPPPHFMGGPPMPSMVQLPGAGLGVFSSAQMGVGLPFSMTSGSPNDGDGGGDGAGAGGSLNLIPSRLPNGDIAFVLPSSQQNSSHPTRGSESPSPPPSGGHSLPPAFPTNPTVVPASGSGHGERRTPSAFTSVLGAAVTTPARSMAAVPPPPTSASAVSPTVTSTTGQCRPGTGPLPSPHPPTPFHRGASTGDLFVKGHHDIRTQLTPGLHPVIKMEADSGLSVCTGMGPGGTSVTPPPSPPPTTSDAAVVFSRKNSVGMKNEANQSEAYDLSKPSTSSVCSVNENDKMWRPW